MSPLPHFKLQEVLLFIWIVIGILQHVGCAAPRLSPALEATDEIHDAEIYRAVVNSMTEWQRRHDIESKNRQRPKREDSASVCYDNLGCFEASGPFGYLDMLPSKPEEIDTKFLLYPGHNRRRSGQEPAEVPFDSIKEAFEWAKQGFNASLPTKVLIHGFGSGCSHIWIYEMRSALMAVEEINVICVDWENGALLPNYVKASANTRLVGKQLASLLRGLVDINGLSLRNTHLVGFSLGAHVAGFAGAELGNLSRITGLDPAGPLFESQDPRARLDQSDADFVDVIHSNGENLILGGLGSYQPMGHVDFYPNGGRMQKGCSNLFVGAVSDIIWSSAVEGRSLCNHRRAYKFFTDSVSPRCHFPAFPCETYEDFLSGKCFPCSDERGCGNMGYYADRSKGRGQLYLATRDEEPFCAHQYHIKIETSPSAVPIVSYGKIQITVIGGESGLNETFMMTKKEDEEMRLGESISRILVPHPILSELTMIQVLYTAYSGWLSSGLTQWRMDKVTISDSFGKISSVCKKNLILDSGVPVLLPLYPGECNLPGNYQNGDKIVAHQTDAQTALNLNITSDIAGNKPFVPTQVVRIGPEDLLENNKELSSKDEEWRSDEKNKVSHRDSEEAESSRAFNSRVVRKHEDGEVHKEILEPILRPTSKNSNNKNARAHDFKESEITEPILRPKSSFGAFKVESVVKNDFIFKLTSNNKEISYNFYDTADDKKEWLPKNKEPETKFNKREDSAKSINIKSPPPATESPLAMMTVQFLPHRLARMFEQAEKYARETILPLVSTYTPKFISDIITPGKRAEGPQYVPLVMEFKEEDDDGLPVAKSREVKESGRQMSSAPVTPQTHIQKIKSNKTKSSSGSNNNGTVRKVRDDIQARKNLLDVKVSTTTTSTKKPIFIDLPIFEKDAKQIKYIPVGSDN